MTRPPFIYSFVTDDGCEKLTYAQYLENMALRKAVNDEKNYERLFLGRTIILFRKDTLAQSEDKLEMVAELEHMQMVNPLQFFAPSSWELVDFLNDTEHDVVAVVAGNRTGKTTHATICLLLGAIPMNKDWPIFTEHGVKWRPFFKPMDMLIASYKEKNLKETVWPKMLRYWTPDSELNIYAKATKVRGARSAPAWGHNMSVPLTCGSSFNLFTYEQGQDNYEGGVYHKKLWDEQPRENLYDAADERARTVKGIDIFSETPHIVEGRPDTGAASFVRGLLSGTNKKGHNPITYTIKLRDVPDWIYPEDQKAKAFEKWENEPKRNNDRKRIAEGRARLYGEWHVTGGLVLDEWNAEASWIDPLWDTPPKDMTLYRAIDHGLTNPTACLWLAVTKNLDVILYRVMYVMGRTVKQNVEAIIEQSGNRRHKLDIFRDDMRGVIMERYEEQFVREYFAKTVLDKRSFNTPDHTTGKPLGWLYSCQGIKVQPASAKFSDSWIPMVQEMLRFDPERRHLITGKLGASRFYVFNTCLAFKQEIEAWYYDGNKPANENDHCMTSLGYAVQSPLRWLGNMYNTPMPDRDEEEFGIRKPKRVINRGIGKYRRV